MKFAMLILIAHAPCLGADFCAVKVFVTDVTGAPAVTLVRLSGSNGVVIDRVTSRKGEAEFCDFGFGSHSIDVAPNSYGHVIIPDVRLVFGTTFIYKVYLNFGGIGDQIPVACATYFRIASPHGDRLSGTTVRTEPAGIDLRADDFGRVLVQVDTYDSGVLEFSHPGYRPARIEYECLKPGYWERSVTLQPVENPKEK